MMIMTISDSPASTGWSSSDDDYDGFASDFPNLHPVLEQAPGVGIELLTPVSEPSGRARHSWSIFKHFLGLINVPYGVAEMVRIGNLEFFWIFSNVAPTPLEGPLMVLVN